MDFRYDGWNLFLPTDIKIWVNLIIIYQTQITPILGNSMQIHI